MPTEEFNPPVKNDNPGGVERVESEAGTPIHVRKVGDYPTYTDEKGRMLDGSEEYIGPGSPVVGEKYEHNPEKAHAMALASNSERSGATELRKSIQTIPQDNKNLEWQKESTNYFAEGFDKRADRLEEIAGQTFDEEAQAAKRVVGEKPRQRTPGEEVSGTISRPDIGMVRDLQKGKRIFKDSLGLPADEQGNPVDEHGELIDHEEE